MKIHFLYCFSFLLLELTRCDNFPLEQFEIWMDIDGQKKFLLSSNIKEIYFDFYGQNAFSCKVPPVLIEDSSVTTRQVSFSYNNDPQKTLNNVKIQAIEIESSNPIISPMIQENMKNTIISPGLTIHFNIDYNCDSQKANQDNFWGIISLIISIENGAPLSFSYKKVCLDHVPNYNFDYSFIIVAVFCVLVIAWGSKKTKILSTLKEFEGYDIGVKFTISYIVIASVLLITLIFSQTIMILIYTFIMAFVTFLAFGLFFNELLTGNLLRYNISKIIVRIPKIGEFPILLILGFVISIPLIVFWGLTYDWIISDIFTLLLTLVCLKLIKFKNLKTATYFFFVEIIFELIWGVIFMYGLQRSYDQFFSSDFTLPLKLECLTFNQYLNKKCVWISITNMVFPGLLLSYFNRYDASKNFNVYFFFALIAFILGNIIWIVVESRVEFATPSSIYSFTLMLLFTLSLAHKRNENRELWNGTFFDVELADPLISNQNLMDNQQKTIENPDITVNSDHDSDIVSYMEGTQNLEEIGSKFGKK